VESLFVPIIVAMLVVSTVTNLTNSATAESSPVWSPDGSRILFTSDRDDPPDHTIQKYCCAGLYVMNADGSDQGLLSNHPGSNVGKGSWSPDGRKIAYSCQDDIYVMNADGSDRINLTHSSDPLDFEYSPAWSPDGEKIVFVRRGDIYVMNANGAMQLRLTNTKGSDEDHPSWSPDGSKIAFQGSGDGYDIYVMASDGSDATNLTLYSMDAMGYRAINMAPAWSPDGTRIAFVSNRGDFYVKTIYIMNADGTNQTRVTDTSGQDVWDPSWSPDGRKIAYSSQGEIYVIDVEEQTIAGGR